MRGIALGLAIATMMVACGGAQQPPPGPDPRDNEITALWTQIRDWRREDKLRLEPIFQVAPPTVRDAKLVCPENHPVPSACNDTCNLADDICDNAERICQLASELGKGDDYAQQKCASAKASCRDSQQKCCSCSAKPAPTGGGEAFH